MYMWTIRQTEKIAISRLATNVEGYIFFFLPIPKCVCAKVRCVYGLITTILIAAQFPLDADVKCVSVLTIQTHH